jgi:hypothetical protein
MYSKRLIHRHALVSPFFVLQHLLLDRSIAVVSTSCFSAAACMLRRPRQIRRVQRRRWRLGIKMLDENTLRGLLICLLVCLICPLLYSQATGSFSGTVSENSGAVR